MEKTWKKGKFSVFSYNKESVKINTHTYIEKRSNFVVVNKRKVKVMNPATMITMITLISVITGIIATICCGFRLKKDIQKKKKDVGDDIVKESIGEVVRGAVLALIMSVVGCALIALLKWLLAGENVLFVETIGYFLGILKFIPIPMALVVPALTMCYSRAEAWDMAREERKREREEARRKEEEENERRREENERRWRQAERERRERWDRDYSNDNTGWSRSGAAEGPFAGMSFKDAMAKYKKLMVKNHPDNGGSEELTKEINAQFAAFKKNYFESREMKGAGAC